MERGDDMILGCLVLLHIEPHKRTSCEGIHGHRESRAPRLDDEGPLVHLLVRQAQGGVKQVGLDFLHWVNLVRGLLEYSNFSNHVSNL